MGLRKWLKFPYVLVVIAVVVILVVSYYSIDNQRNSVGPVGARNKAMLSGPYWGIQFEIDHMPGVPPSQDAMDRLAGFVREHTGKTTIFRVNEIQSYAGPTPSDPTLPCLIGPCTPEGGYSIEQVVAIHGRERNEFPLPGVLTVWILYADRHSDEGEQIGGAAFCATCIVLFGPGTRTDVVQGIILAHEFGHLLGLCAINYADVRGHCDGEGHSADPRSLMYYAPDLDSPSVQALRLNADELADLEDLRNDVL